ncbi:MAG TPA: SpoIIE family protein phosphatase [Candidatus Angelobacter sp.]|nr:SpoIIE family protein phosphatase [Candidatus Angelobacter sp.]
MATVPASRSQEIALLIETAGQRRRVTVSKSPFTIGRAEECDATISDFRVSRLHARLEKDGKDGLYYISDAGSRHGTFINGHPAQHSRVRHNDEITLGVSGLRLLFQEGSTVSSATQVLLRKFSSESVSSELEKLTLFLEAARTLSSGVVVNDVLRNMLEYALKLTKAERGFVYLKQPKGEALACGLDNAGNALTQDANVSRSVVHEALTTAGEFITGDATQQSALAGRHSIMLNELRTVIAIPLRQRRVAPGSSGAPDVEGVLYLDSRSVSRNLSGVSHDVLRALANECAAVMESARLMEAERAAQQYHQEMQIAASIQRSLIPESEPECGFARARGRSIPCREVGGDFFDVCVSPEAVTVIVADVSGKGISAALLASVIHGMFYAQITSGAGLVDAISSINRFLCSRVAGQKYATLLAARLQKDGKLEIINCGHVPPIIAESGSVTHIEEGDLPVGLMPDVQFHVIERRLAPGSRLCVVTDGISESENDGGVEFGLERVEQCAQAGDPLAETLNAVNIFCGEHEAQDDRTLLVLERTS